jgi:hypothetical protein
MNYMITRYGVLGEGVGEDSFNAYIYEFIRIVCSCASSKKFQGIQSELLLKLPKAAKRSSDIRIEKLLHLICYLNITLYPGHVI